MKNKIFLLTSILSLTGCTPAYDDLNEWMTKTRQDAKSHIIPFEAPVVNPPAVYNPPAYSGLNAFDFRRLDNAPKGNNAPNPNRPKEALEGVRRPADGGFGRHSKQNPSGRPSR